MIILGIDPGYERLGMAMVEKNGGEKEKMLYSNCFKTSSKLAFPERLALIGKEVERIMAEYSPEALAIENLFLSTNQKTAMHVAEVRGMLIHLAAKNSLAVKEFTPLQIKSAITGHGKSDKNSMIKMIPLLIKISKEIKHDDEYDAIAVALTYFAYTRQNK